MQYENSNYKIEIIFGNEVEICQFNCVDEN